MITEEIKNEIKKRLQSGDTEFIKFILNSIPDCIDCINFQRGYIHTFGLGYTLNCKINEKFESHDINICEKFKPKN